MKPIRALFVLCISLLLPLQASACCLFPFFPTYRAGYGGWGYAYAPAYNYGYSAPYSVSYGGSAACCGSSCGSSCCGTSCCGTSCCGSSCAGGSCISTETRKEAVPDPISNESDPAPADPRTFGSEGYDRNPADGGRRDDRSDDFRGGGTGSGLDTPEEARPWDRSRDSSGGAGGTESPSQPFDFDADIPGRGGFDGSSSSNKPATEGTEGGSSIIERGANKPPINVPLEEDTSSDDGTDADADTKAGVTPGTETTPQDFLPPEDATTSDARAYRTSHFGVVSFKRLAAGSEAARGTATMISSGESKEAALRWISLPAPIGQVRR
ncbi:MAG: hypothetical protein RIK87_17365 [Fuerstiella sp.]